MNKKPLKIYILGISGYLGTSFAAYLCSHGYIVQGTRVDVSNLPVLRDAFRQTRPDIVINLTGPSAYPTIDWCEDHKEESAKMLVAAPVNIVLAALECGAYPIQVTSGCIYSGGPDHEFTEEDAPNFFGSFYSRMRIASEQALRELPVLLARIRMPISTVPHPRNFINKITSYKKVISIPNSVTVLEDLWPGLMKLGEYKKTGIINMTNDGYIEHKNILAAYKRVVDPTHDYEPISIQELDGPGGITKAKRSNCVLSVVKRKNLGIDMPALRGTRLDKLLRKYKKYLTLENNIRSAVLAQGSSAKSGG